MKHLVDWIECYPLSTHQVRLNFIGEKPYQSLPQLIGPSYQRLVGTWNNTSAILSFKDYLWDVHTSVTDIRMFGVWRVVNTNIIANTYMSVCLLNTHAHRYLPLCHMPILYVMCVHCMCLCWYKIDSYCMSLMSPSRTNWTHSVSLWIR